MTPLTNPADAYKTWLMGVRRALQRTGYPEAAKRVGDYDRDLRGVYLSGAGPAEGAGVVSRRWAGGYNANAYNPPNMPILIASALAFGAVLLYVTVKPPKVATSATSGAPTTTTPTPALAPVAVAPSLCQPKSKVDAFAKSVGKHATYDQTNISASPSDTSVIAYVADYCSFYAWDGTRWAKDDATNANFGTWLTQLGASLKGSPADMFVL